MKKSEVAMIILVAGVSVLVAFFIARSIPFLQVNEQEVRIPRAEQLSADVADPDPRVFNDRAINPTVKTVIGE